MTRRPSDDFLLAQENLQKAVAEFIAAITDGYQVECIDGAHGVGNSPSSISPVHIAMENQMEAES